MSENPSDSTAATDPDATSVVPDADANGAAPHPAGIDPELVAAFVAPGDFVGVDGPAAFVEESALTDGTEAPAAGKPARRARRLVIIGIAALVVVAGGTIGTIQLVGGNGAAGCLVGSWAMSQFPAELANTGAEMTAGQMTVSFTSGGQGRLRLTDIHVKAVSGPNSVVQADISYSYSASDSLITYTKVNGNLIIAYENVTYNEPYPGMAPDTYSCSGNTLAVNTQSKHPEVFTRT